MNTLDIQLIKELELRLTQTKPQVQEAEYWTKQDDTHNSGLSCHDGVCEVTWKPQRPMVK